MLSAKCSLRAKAGGTSAGKEGPRVGQKAGQTAAATLHLNRGYETQVADTGILFLGQELNAPQTCRFLALTADPQNPNFWAGAQESGRRV